MSWGFEVSGTKAAVRAYAEEQFTKAAAYYPGTSEEQDILAAKARVLDAIDAMEPEDFANGVRVAARGSQSVGFCASLSFEVSRVFLCLDAPATPAVAPAAPSTPAAPETPAAPSSGTTTPDAPAPSTPAT